MNDAMSRAMREVRSALYRRRRWARRGTGKRQCGVRECVIVRLKRGTYPVRTEALI